MTRSRRLQRLVRATYAIAIAAMLVGLLPGRRVESDDCMGRVIDGLAMTEGHGPVGHCTSRVVTEPAGGPADLVLGVFVVVALVPASLVRRAPTRRLARASALMAGVIVVVGAALGFLLEFTLDLFQTTTLLWPQHVVVAAIAALMALAVAVAVTARAVTRDRPMIPAARVR